VPTRDWLARVAAAVHSSNDTRYRALAAALRDAIEADHLPVGARLPPQRELARLLGVGRTTIVSAYNLLRAEALVRPSQGAAPGLSIGRTSPGRSKNPVRRLPAVASAGLPPDPSQSEVPSKRGLVARITSAKLLG
jgi:DNA-binding transcriptional MocR family regulator